MKHKTFETISYLARDAAKAPHNQRLAPYSIEVAPLEAG